MYVVLRHLRVILLEVSVRGNPTTKHIQRFRFSRWFLHILTRFWTGSSQNEYLPEVSFERLLPKSLGRKPQTDKFLTGTLAAPTASPKLSEADEALAAQMMAF